MRFVKSSAPKGLLIAMMAMLMPLVLTACSKPVLKVNEAKVTLSPVDTNPSVLHFTVYGGPSDVELLKVFSKSAIRIEIHNSSKDPKTGMMSMEKLNSVKIPTGERVQFEKGGKHVMIWGVNRIARRLGEMEFEFVFSDGTRILKKAAVRELDGSMPDEHRAIMD